jgi:tetratricopeptide (TPR) repeat protein
MRAIFLSSALLLSCQLLTSCGSGASWDRSYNLRQWEKLRITAESAFLAGDYEHAQELMQGAVDFAANIGGTDFRLGNTLSLLGDAANRNGKKKEALAYYERALSQLDASMVRENNRFDRRLLQEDIASVALKVGDLALQKGDLAAAESSYGQALNLYKQWIGSQPGQLICEGYGRSLFGLAVLDSKRGKLDRAAKTFHLALNSPATDQYSGRLRDQLEQLYQATTRSGATTASVEAVQPGDQFKELMLAAKAGIESKDFLTSRQKYAEAVAVGEKSGVDKEKLASAYHGLAKSFDWLKQKDAAEQYYLKELALRETLVGQEDHYDFILAKLARLCHSRHDEKSAFNYLSRLIKLRKSMTGQDSTDMGEALTQLTAVNLAMGQKSEALKNALKGLTLLSQTDKLRGDTLTCIDEMSSLLLALGQYKEASAANDRIIETCRRKKSRSTRCQFATLRTAAIAAQQSSLLRDSQPSVAALIAGLEFAGEESRYDLIHRLNSEAFDFVEPGQLYAAALLAQASLTLNEQGQANHFFVKAKLHSLSILSTVENKLGNKEKKARLDAEIAQLHARTP